MDQNIKSVRRVSRPSSTRVSSASEDSLNDFKTPPSNRASKLPTIRNSDDSPPVRFVDRSFDNRPDENQPGPSNTRKTPKRAVSPPDDSLADFKSPKLEAKPIIKLLDKPKTKPKKTKKGKTKKDSNQMSIESSFFKPATSFACPLCLKTFADSASQLAHSKTCASKNNVSTRKLLEAVALQERQGEERRALGLPAQPFAQPKRKSTFKRSDLRSGDPDVQLALALSESLQEAQDLEDLDAAIALAGDEVPMTSSQRRSTLRNFGFITNKPVVEVTERPKKKKLNAQTVLQTRTEDTRQRLLAERIAEAIIDNADITCVDVCVEDEDLGEIKLISKKLKDILEPEKKLWRGSAKKGRGEFYYVKNLEDFIAPTDSGGEEKNFDDNFPRSQLGEFNNVDIENYPEDEKAKKEDKTLEEMEKVLKSSQKTLEHSQSVLEAAEKSLEPDCSLRLSTSWSEGNFVDASLNLNKISPEKVATKKETPKKTSGKNDPISRKPMTPEDHKKIKETPKKGRKSFVENSLANSWRKMLNSTQCSDVIIFCADDKIIYAHSVVLWTRCEELYHDLSSESNQAKKLENFGSEKQFKYQISWEEVNFNTAFVFLEFIYCGHVENLNTEIDELMLLVKKYNYGDFSRYLKKNNNVINVSIDRSMDQKMSNNSYLSPINVRSNYTNVTMSPDIFDDMESITCDNFVKIQEKVADSTTNNNAVDLLPTVDNESVDNKSVGKNEEEKKEVVDDVNLKNILRRSSTCPDSLRNTEKIETPRSFSEDLNDTLKKTRSELSVFIEKIKRRNAKDILDDSDDDSFLPEIKQSNKFKKADQSLSDQYKNVKIDTSNINLRRGSRFWTSKKSIEKPEKVEVKKSALSIFEDEIREKVALEPDKFQGLCDGFESDFELDDKEVNDISNLTQSFNADDPNVSMYSKYKLTHKDNSIAYYRDLVKESKNSQSEDEVSVEKSFSQKVVSGDNEFLASPKQSADPSADEEKKSNVDLGDDLVIEIDDEDVEQAILSQKSQLDIEFEDDDFEDDDFNVDKIIEESFNPQKSAVDFRSDSRSVSLSDKVIDVDLDYDDDKSVEHFFTGNQSEDDVINSSQRSSGTENRRISTTNRLYLQELSSYDLYKSKEQNIDEESVLDLTLSEDEKEDRSLKRQRSAEESSTVESSDEEIFSLKKKKSSISLDLSEDEKSNENLASQGKTITSDLTNILKECGVISQTPKSPISVSSHISLSDDSEESPVNSSFGQPPEISQFVFEGEADLADNFVTSTQAPSTASSDFRLRRSITVSPVKNKSRLLINKSKSTDFSVRFSNHPEINKEEVCNYLKLSQENVILSEAVEQRADFNLLSSPELNRKLNSYGLKNQKRHRAIKLLTYIFESLNPLVPEEIVRKKENFPNVQQEYKWRIESLLRTDDEEGNEERNVRVSNLENDRESVCSELPEEIDLSDAEYEQKDLKTVKEAFEILLNEDVDLHRKVLMYESLPIEALHAKVQDRGVSCSMKLLMDYLNEECISFYVEAPKKWSSGRRKPKKYK